MTPLEVYFWFLSEDKSDFYDILKQKHKCIVNYELFVYCQGQTRVGEEKVLQWVVWES